MQMKHWKNSKGEVWGYDVSDPSQLEARDIRFQTDGPWEDVSDSWPPPPAPPSSTENRAKAKILLSKTDWVNEPDVYDETIDPHLTNRDAFLAYRSQLRAIMLTASSGYLDWPEEPAAVWSLNGQETMPSSNNLSTGDIPSSTL